MTLSVTAGGSISLAKPTQVCIYVYIILVCCKLEVLCRSLITQNIQSNLRAILMRSLKYMEPIHQKNQLCISKRLTKLAIILL